MFWTAQTTDRVKTDVLDNTNHRQGEVRISGQYKGNQNHKPIKHRQYKGNQNHKPTKDRQYKGNQNHKPIKDRQYKDKE